MIDEDGFDNMNTLDLMNEIDKLDTPAEKEFRANKERQEAEKTAPLSYPLATIVDKLPAKSVNYSDDGKEFKIECTASALVKFDDIVTLFNQIRRLLPKIKYYDVRSSVYKTEPGPEGKVLVKWYAITAEGRFYLAELAQQIGLMMQKKLSEPQPPQTALTMISGVPALIQHASDVLREHHERAQEIKTKMME